jgi:anti-anti-sigma factor
MSRFKSHVPKANAVGSVRVGVHGDLVVRLHGELDLATRDELEDLLAASRSSAVSTVRVDLSRVSFIDASSVGVIVAAWLAARARGQLCGVDGLAEQPARVFEVLGLHCLLLRPGFAHGQKGGSVDIRRIGAVGRRRDPRGPRAAR